LQRRSRDLCSPRIGRDVVLDGLFREHGRALGAFAQRLCASEADASDLVQDVLERALRSFESFSPGTNARAWLFAILHHAFIDRCRSKGAERRARSIDDLDLVAPERTPPPAWTNVSREQVDEAIAALDDEFRAVYRMHAVEALSYREIGVRLGIPPATSGPG
jgi:RNA polymerase sigma-70 factor (ECF subfamily)